MFLHDHLLACEISTVRTQTLRKIKSKHHTDRTVPQPQRPSCPVCPEVCSPFLTLCRQRGQ